MGDREALAGALRAVVAEALGDDSVAVDGLRRLSGGASRETWSFDAVCVDGDRQELILRRDPPGAPKAGMGLEALVLGAAARAAVPVPTILAASDDPNRLGAPFIVMERLNGETIPRRILRDDAYREARPLLAAQCGRILAQIHRIPVGDVPGLALADPVEEWRRTLHELGEPHPAFELGLRWLDANRPAWRAPGVVHGDFRNGNLIIGPEGVRSVLDWELAHLGDPMEDLGWLCVRAWRFGLDRPVGGFGDYDQLIDAYEEEAGTRRRSSRPPMVGGTRHPALGRHVHHPGLDAHVGVRPVGRAGRHRPAGLRERMGPAQSSAGTVGRKVTPEGERPDGPWPAGPHDAPTAAELIEAVREFLETDVMDVTDGRVQFHTRVAVNVLGVVQRELDMGQAQAARHAAGLTRLGLADDASLAAAIGTGLLDDRLDEVAAFVRQTVEDKLTVANPRYFGGRADPP